MIKKDEAEYAVMLREWETQQMQMWADLVAHPDEDVILEDIILKVSLARGTQSLRQTAFAIDETGMLYGKLEEKFAYAFIEMVESTKVFIVSIDGRQGRVAIWKQGKYVIVEQAKGVDAINIWLVDRGELLGLGRTDMQFLMLPWVDN